MKPDALETAVNRAVVALREVGHIAAGRDEWDLRVAVDQMMSDLLDAWERAE
jgi:hypothetical protein